MYWNIVDDGRLDTLRQIVETVTLDDYYMAGGTALSFQLGLRNSYDFDFFVPNAFNPEILYEELKSIGCDIRTLNLSNGTCDVTLNGIQVSFFYYPYKMLAPYVLTDEIPKLRLAAVTDIACMKAVAIGNRGAKKDFCDLFYILQQTDMTIEKLVQSLNLKYGDDKNLFYIGKGLTYFEDAEHEVLPKMFVPYHWQRIKDYFLVAGREFIQAYERLYREKRQSVLLQRMGTPQQVKDSATEHSVPSPIQRRDRDDRER